VKRGRESDWKGIRRESFKTMTIILYYVTEDHLKLLIGLDSAIVMEMYSSSILGVKKLCNQMSVALCYGPI